MKVPLRKVLWDEKLFENLTKLQSTGKSLLLNGQNRAKNSWKNEKITEAWSLSRLSVKVKKCVYNQETRIWYGLR